MNSFPSRRSGYRILVFGHWMLPPVEVRRAEFPRVTNSITKSKGLAHVSHTLQVIFMRPPLVWYVLTLVLPTLTRGNGYAAKTVAPTLDISLGSAVRENTFCGHTWATLPLSTTTAIWTHFSFFTTLNTEALSLSVMSHCKYMSCARD